MQATDPIIKQAINLHETCYVTDVHHNGCLFKLKAVVTDQFMDLTSILDAFDFHAFHIRKDEVSPPTLRFSRYLNKRRGYTTLVLYVQAADPGMAALMADWMNTWLYARRDTFGLPDKDE